jgi:formylglycine-generating enzyme required for sulfatase activity
MTMRMVGKSLLVALGLLAAPAAHADGDMQPIGRFAIDRTEVSVGAFRRFIVATGMVTMAERQGGGSVFEAGWVRKPGWTWSTPFGEPADEREPAVHITFDEAAAYCRWAGKRLPTDAEWLEAAHTERRASPPAPFQNGTSCCRAKRERLMAIHSRWAIRG